MTMTPVQPPPATGPAPAFMPWYVKPGDHIDQYTICTGLGEGSGGVVYDVQDAAGAHFALKLSRFPLAPTGRPSVLCDRFQLSAMAHLALNDVPNVAKLIGFNTLHTPQGAFPYLVMELVPGGETITAWVQRTSPSLAKLVSVFIDIAAALGTLADMKICHRDLKPQNILVAPGDIPKIVDFNSVAFPAQKTITYPAASAIPGTLAYFSPELAAAVLAEIRTRIQKPYTYAPTDDLYALGAVFYEVLTGELPCCQLDEPEEVMLRQIVGLQPVRLHDLNPSIPWPIGKVVTKLLRKDPRERYQSGHEVAADLQAAYRGTADKNWQVPFIVGPCEVNPTLPLWLVPSTPIAPADLSTEKGPPPSAPAPDAPAPEPKEMSTCHILYIEGTGLPEARRAPEPVPAEGEAEAAEAPSEGDSSAAPPVTGAAAEWQPLAVPDGSRAAHAGRPAAGVRARLPAGQRGWRFLRKFAERFGRAAWKPIAIAGSGALVGCLAVLVAPLLAGAAAQPGPLVVIVPAIAMDHSPVQFWFEPGSLAALADPGGPKRPAEQYVPRSTLPGQKVAPCDTEAGEEDITGNCWIWVGAVKPPCGYRTFRQGDKCYRPVAADSPRKPAP